MGESAESVVTEGILTGREEAQRRTRERTMFSKVTIFLGIISVAAFQECKYLGTWSVCTVGKGHVVCG